MSAFTGTVGAEIVPEVERVLADDLAREFPDAASHGTLTERLLGAARSSGRKFVFVIDEWDAVFRESAYDEASQERYVKFLRVLFKNASFTAEAVEGAYITGILPIKRYGTQSAMTDFEEFTMVRPFRYAPYVGFMEDEVDALCREYGMDADEMRRWYDGYELPGAGHVYAPFSVMRACDNGMVGPYWTSSETFEMLRDHIDLDFDGLQGDIVRAVGGESLSVNPYMFANDMTSLRNKDDALTLLVHLGYLAYDDSTRSARVPNEEVRAEFQNALSESRHPECARIIRESDQLLRALIAGDESTAAQGIQRAHDASCAPTFYNDEQALRAVIRAALIAAVDDYARVEELPSGHGYADIAYIPKPGSGKPPLLVELKWDKPVDAAIDQLHDRDYPAVLRELGTPVIAAGITYDSKTKEHSCVIERI